MLSRETLEIQNDARIQDRNFSFSKTLGSFINNRKFSAGYTQFLDGEHDSKTYIWETLSAIGDDLGQVIYGNVLNYVDTVSNVETCKVKALDSMMDELGVEYGVFDLVGRFPHGIVDLMDIFSIDRKYLLAGDLIKEGLISRLEDTSAIIDLSSDAQVSSYIASIISGNASSDYDLDVSVLMQDMYDSARIEMFREYILGHLLQTVDVEIRKVGQTSAETRNIYVFPAAIQDRRNGTFFRDASILEFKRKNNITVDQASIVDRIEDGYDRLDMYQGATKELLEMEIERRNRMVLDTQIPGLGEDEQIQSARKARYFWYKEREVLEYVDFVNQTYNHIQDANVDRYDLDPAYYEIRLSSYDQIRSVIPLDRTIPYDEENIDQIPDREMVAAVADRLVRMCNYICKIREKLKLQTQKNYMRGTNNLLVYMVNEYLRNYSYTGDATTQVQNSLSAMSSHSLNDVDIIEYYDSTEYYNISTQTTISSEDSEFVPNERYWTGTMDSQPVGDLTLNQIDQFYLSTMVLNGSAGNAFDHNDLTSFLDAIYGKGADATFIDKNGNFATRLGTDTEYTNQYYDTLVRLRNDFSELTARKSKDYNYPEGAVSAQISNLVHQDIFGHLSSERLSGTNWLEVKYGQVVNDMAGSLQSAIADYETIVGMDYGFYFLNYGNGNDYLVGNPDYKADGIRGKIDDLVDFIEKYGIHNTSLHDATLTMIDNVEDLSSQLRNDVVARLSSFQDSEYGTFNSEIGYVSQFLDQMIENRRQFIRDSINDIKTQTQSLRDQFVQIDQAFMQAVASYDSGSPDYKIGDISVATFSSTDGTGGYNCKTQLTATIKAVKQYIVEPGTGWTFYSKDAGPYTMIPYTFNDGERFSSDSFLRQKCDQISAWMEVKTFDEKQGLKKDGMVAVLSQTIQSLSRLDETLQVVISTLKDIFQVDYLATLGLSIKSYNTRAIETRLDEFQKFINLNLDENLVNNDAKYRLYNDLKLILTRIQDIYTIRLQEFGRVTGRAEQVQYLGDFSDKDQISEPSLSVLNGIVEYIVQTDSTNISTLSERVGSLNNTVTDLQSRYSEIAGQLSVVDYQVQDPYYIQEDLDHLMDFVTFYKQREDERLLEEISVEIETEVDPLILFIEQQISGSMGLSSNFEDVVKARIDELNYFEYDQYRSDYRMFLRLGGKDMCFYPYWNFKNTIHPSYQIHPFLWNFVEKTDTRDTVKEVFYSHNVDELLSSKISAYIDRMLGEYGEIVDKWRFPDIRDFSGYSSKYEKSRHAPGKYMKFSEVVDYEGPFYPPAIDHMKAAGSDFGRILKSIVGGYTSMTISEDIKSSTRIRDMLASGTVVAPESLFAEIRWIADVADISEDALLSTVQGYLTDTSPNDYRIGKFADRITSACGETFYGKYYFHLQLDADQRKYVADQLSVYYFDPPEDSGYTTIGDIVSGDEAGNEFDIYRYGEDINGNMYILYKKYGISDATFVQKRNTPGTLWIRLKDHPVAFPAFAGRYPQVDMTNVNIAIMEMDTTDYDEFYDFVFSEDATQMHLVTKNHTSGVEDTVKTYDNPWIVMTPLGMTEDGPLLVDMSHDPNLRDYIESGWGETEPTRLCSVAEYPVVNYRYLGYFTNHDDDIDHVYVLNSYALSGSELADTVLVVSTKDCVVHGTPLSTYCDFSEQVSDQITFGKYLDGSDAHLVVAYVEKNDVGNLKSLSSLGENVVLSSNTFGLPTTAPTSRDQVTSHDVYEGNIRVVDFLVEEESTTLKASSRYNTNADMSYIPSYPGYENRIRLNEVDVTKDVFNVEFLGKVGDLDSSISRVVEDVDPYIDEERMNANDIFGRVYEDWDEEWANQNRTARVFKCPMMNFRDDNTGHGLCWRIHTDNLGTYLSDFNQVKVLMMNTTNLGKNPYIVADLSSMIDAPMSAYYTTNPGEGPSIDMVGAETVGVNSTPNPLDNLDMGSNRIRGFVGIDAQFFPDNGYIDVRFYIDPVASKLEYFHIDEGQVQLILFNDNNITLFEKYHILDPYGFVSILSASKEQILNIYQGMQDNPDDGRGWGIYYTIPEETVTPLVKSYCYYILSNGTPGFMDELQLSDYSDLSDVYVFQDSDRLSFKYSEEHMFGFGDDNYYFPVLNRKYPKTWAKTVQESVEKNLVTMEENQIGFNSENTYVVTMEDPDVIANSLGDVVIGIQRDNVGTMMVYEDFLDYDEQAGMCNNEKYFSGDARNAPWVQFTETSSTTHISAMWNELSAARTMDDVSKILYNQPIPIYSMRHEAGNAIGTVESQEFSVLSGNCNLDGALDIYFTYKTTDSGIRIYANYQNYIETPYVELRDGLEYPVIKDGTYVKLEPGESGDLNCMVQLRYMYGGNVRGIRDVVLASYRIYNVSDDKPKVVIRRISTLEKNSLSDVDIGNKMKISVKSINIDARDVNNGKFDVPTTVFIQTPKRLNVPYEIGLFYPIDMISCGVDEVNYQYRTDTSIPGYIKISVDVGCNTNVQIPFRTVGRIDLTDTSVKYMSFSENPIYGHDDVKMNVEYQEGKVRVVSPVYPVLLGNGQVSDTTLSAYLCEVYGTAGVYLNPT